MACRRKIESKCRCGDHNDYFVGTLVRGIGAANDVGAVRLMMVRLRRKDNEISACGGYEIMAMPL